MGRDNVVIRTMIYASFINLWKLDHVDHRAFDVAQTIVRLIHQLSDGDYQYLDPIIGVRDAYFAAFRVIDVFSQVLWFSTVDVFNQALRNPGFTNSLQGGVSINSCNASLDVLYHALKKLAIFYPLACALVLVPSVPPTCTLTSLLQHV